MVHLINAIVLGHALTYLAIFLNYQTSNKYGVLAGVLALAAGYFCEGMYAFGTNYPALASLLQYAAIALVVFSYIIWFF